jgi:hypothetical protein
VTITPFILEALAVGAAPISAVVVVVVVVSFVVVIVVALSVCAKAVSVKPTITILAIGTISMADRMLLLSVWCSSS